MKERFLNRIRVIRVDLLLSIITAIFLKEYIKAPFPTKQEKGAILF